MNWYQRLRAAERAGRNLRVRFAKTMKQFDPNAPVISNEDFITIIDNPQGIDHATVQNVTILSCGHPFIDDDGNFTVTCICGRTYCGVCGYKKARICNICGVPLLPCCTTYSSISRRHYCPRHRWYWLIGR